MALFLGLSLLRFELELPQGGRPLWQGYQVLLIGEENLVEAHQLLEDRGYRVLSLRNQRVSIYDYDGWQNFLLTAMSSEMDPLDPRIDPCLSQLSGYFYAWKRGDDGKEARWSILYVETPDSPGLLDRKIEHLFSEAGIDYALPEGEGMRKDVLWLLGGMFFFSLALLLRKNWWQIFFIFLPWGASIISGRPEVVFSNNLAALSLIFIHKKLHFIRQFQLDYPLAGRARVFRLFSSAWPGFLLFGVSLVLLILTHDRGGLTGILIGALAHLGWMGSESAFHEWRRLRRIHRLYHPLLLADNLDLRQLPKKRAIFLGLVLLSMPLLSLFAGGAGGDWRLPSPEFRDGTLSWENLESLWEADSPGGSSQSGGFSCPPGLPGGVLLRRKLRLPSA